LFELLDYLIFIRDRKIEGILVI